MIEMIKAGSTLREVGKKYGFTYDEMREFKKRYNRKQKMLAAGIEPLKRGRPRKDCEYTDETKVEYYKRKLRLAEYENNRLKMEILQLGGFCVSRSIWGGSQGSAVISFSEICVAAFRSYSRSGGRIRERLSATSRNSRECRQRRRLSPIPRLP